MVPVSWDGLVAGPHEEVEGDRRRLPTEALRYDGEEGWMPREHGNTDLLNDLVATELLQTAIPARLACTWSDGAPRVVPPWFCGPAEIAFISPPSAPRLRAVAAGSVAAERRLQEDAQRRGALIHLYSYSSVGILPAPSEGLLGRRRTETSRC